MTGVEPATSTLARLRSSQLSYTRESRLPSCGLVNGRSAAEQLPTIKFSRAERVGFEPTVPFWGTHDFQSCPFDHSGTSPYNLAPVRFSPVATRLAAILRWASSARRSRTSSRSCSRSPLSRGLESCGPAGRKRLRDEVLSVLARRSSVVERVAANEGNGEGGIRTHGAFLGHTRFRVVRLQPDSATSPGRGPLTLGRAPRNRKRQLAPPDEPVRPLGLRRAAKNSRSRRALWSASTPPSTATA